MSGISPEASGPTTPVVICWIRRGWGSYFSYFKGPPTKNKPIDRGHSVSVAISEPQVLNAEILADQRQTRKYLMEQCLEARKFLGLEPTVLNQVETEAAEEA